MADVARLVVYFEGDTSDLDKAYDRAERRRDRFIRDSGRSDDVKLTGDDSDLSKTYDKASKDNERFISSMTKNSMIKLQGDASGLNRAYSQARKSQSAFIRDANRTSTVKLSVDSSSFNSSLSRSTGALGEFSDSSRATQADSDRLGAAFSRLGGNSQQASGGLHEVAASMRSVKTVFVATTVIPAVIAALGAIPAVATAAAGAVGQLAIGFGQGLAGAFAIGGTAIYGAIGALKAYTAAISSTVSASREAYLATHEKVEAQLEERRQTILNTNASIRFNQQVDRTTIAMTKWQAIIGRAVFPIFTRELRAWTNLMPRFNDYLSLTARELATIAGRFSRWVRTARDGQILQRSFQFINASAQNAARTLAALGRSGLRVFQVLIAPATRLQEKIVDLARSMEQWTSRTENMRQVAGIVQVLEHRFNQLVTIVRNFGRGLIGVFQALNNTGGVDRLMNGLVGLSQGFDRLMQKGNGARQAIVTFMQRSNPALNQMWKLTKEVVIQFGLLANNVVKAGQAGGKMGTLAQVIAGIRKSISPLRKMFQETFIALGPVLARLIPELVKFMSVFLGSTGPLVQFLRAMTQILRVFNALPGPVKSLVANLVALKAIMGGIGITSLVGGLVKARVSMAALSVATGRQVGIMGALSAAFPRTAAAAGAFSARMRGVGAATTASGAATAAAGTRFAAFRAAISRIGPALLGVAGVLTGGWAIAIAAAVAGGVLLYKNWDRIRQAAQPLTQVLSAIGKSIGALGRMLGGALMTGLRAVGQGFMQAVAPGKSFHGATVSLSNSLSRLAKAVLPPVSRALAGLGQWMQEHQRAFRVLGQIIGGIVVGAFKLLGGAAMGAFKVIRLGVNIIRGMIKVMTTVTKATQNFGRNVGTSIRNMAQGVVKAIRSMGSTVVKIWQNSIFGRMAKYLVDRAKGMLRTLSNFRQSAVNWVRSLVPRVVQFWRNNVWQPAADFLVDKKTGWMNTLSNFMQGAVNWVQQFPSRVGTLWKKFWQGAADFVIKIKDGIMNTMGNLVDGVISLWNKLIGFINNVLDAVGLDPIGTGGSNGGGSSGPTAGTVNSVGGGLNRPGAARGGLTSGTQEDAYRQFGGTPVQMARGGLASGREPRLVYGEAGPEAYVTLGRYTKESAEALMKANEVWGEKGWMGRAAREHRRAPDTGHRPRSLVSRQVASRIRGGEGLGPTTYNWSPLMQGYKRQLDQQFPGTTRNTYVGHPGGEQHSMDNWGAGGRGSNIDPGTGDAISSWIQSNVDKLNWLIWKGRILDASGWSSYNDPSDKHFDHVHFTAGSPGGGAAGDALSIWERVGEAMWNRLVGPIYNTFMRWQDPGKFALRRGAGKAGTNALDSIREWIISQTGGTGVSSDALGGDPAKNRALGEQMFKSSGIGGSFSSLDSLWMRESGWDRFARNPSSGAYGIPQALPESKLPREGQRAGGSKAGPQISWGLNYIDDRYGSTDKAWQHSQATGWYARGGIIPGVKGRQVLVQAHSGERVLPTDMVKSFDRLANVIQSWSRNAGGHRSGNVHGGTRAGISVGPQGVFMPGLSVTARGVQINPRQLHRGAFAQEDAAKTLRRVERRLGDLDKRIGREVREGINRNVERGLNTNRALDKSDARRLARQLAGGPRISRAL